MKIEVSYTETKTVKAVLDCPDDIANDMQELEAWATGNVLTGVVDKEGESRVTNFTVEYVREPVITIGGDDERS